MASRARRLRELLAATEPIVAPFVYDGLQARLAERAGFDVVYMTGFGTAMARGLPDIGLLGMSEMLANLRPLAAAVEIPVVADADTGYGDALNVARTVHEYEDAGAAGLHIEDQVWPKRCGFLEGKEVIPADEMVAKVRAACAARRDPDTVVIARSDALAPCGWDETERRLRAYRDAGADLLFADGIRSADDLETYATRLGDLPLVYNGQRPVRHPAFRLVLHGASMAASFAAIRDALAELRASGQVERARDPGIFGEMLDVLGLPEALERGRRFATPASPDQ